MISFIRKESDKVNAKTDNESMDIEEANQTNNQDKKPQKRQQVSVQQNEQINNDPTNIKTQTLEDIKYTRGVEEQTYKGIRRTVSSFL